MNPNQRGNRGTQAPQLVSESIPVPKGWSADGDGLWTKTMPSGWRFRVIQRDHRKFVPERWMYVEGLRETVWFGAIPYKTAKKACEAAEEWERESIGEGKR